MNKLFWFYEGMRYLQGKHRNPTQVEKLHNAYLKTINGVKTSDASVSHWPGVTRGSVAPRSSTITVEAIEALAPVHTVYYKNTTHGTLCSRSAFQLFRGYVVQSNNTLRRSWRLNTQGTQNSITVRAGTAYVIGISPVNRVTMVFKFIQDSTKVFSATNRDSSLQDSVDCSAVYGPHMENGDYIYGHRSQLARTASGQDARDLRIAQRVVGKTSVTPVTGDSSLVDVVTRIRGGGLYMTPTIQNARARALGAVNINLEDEAGAIRCGTDMVLNEGWVDRYGETGTRPPFGSSPGRNTIKNINIRQYNAPPQAILEDHVRGASSVVYTTQARPGVSVRMISGRPFLVVTDDVRDGLQRFDVRGGADVITINLSVNRAAPQPQPEPEEEPDPRGPTVVRRPPPARPYLDPPPPVDPNRLRWERGIPNEAVLRRTITRGNLPLPLPRAIPGSGIQYFLGQQGTIDSTLTIDGNHRLVTRRPHLYVTPKRLVLVARRGSEEVFIFIDLAIAATLPLSFAGYEYLRTGEEVTLVVGSDDSIGAWRPVGGRAPYLQRLIDVSPENSVAYDPNTGLLSFPNGLETGAVVRGTMEAIDIAGGKGRLPFRIVKEDIDTPAYKRVIRNQLEWTAGHENGSTLLVNIEAGGTFRLPTASRPDVNHKLTGGPGAPDFDTGVVNVNLDDFLGIPFRTYQYTVTRGSQTLIIFLKVTADKPFAFRGGHGNRATYRLVGANDLASIKLPRANFLAGRVQYRLEQSNRDAANLSLVEGTDTNTLLIGDISDNIDVAYRATNGSDSAYIIYQFRTAPVSKPAVPPEGGALKAGVSKTLTTLDVDVANSNREPVNPTLAWVDECVEQVDAVQYVLTPNDTRINLPTVVSPTGTARYELIPLGTTPEARVEDAAKQVVLPTVTAGMRYRLVVSSGDMFLSKDLHVTVDGGNPNAGPDYIAACDEVPESDLVTPGVVTVPTGEIANHFCGVLVEGNRVARLPGTVVSGYKGLITGQRYGVDHNGRLARTSDGPLQALSDSELIIRRF